ncbi:glycosyltransferase family 2 protein [Myxococcaceae bacterium GXIMD 01537]
MSARPELTIVIPWANRPELDVTLRRNRRFLAKPSFEVLVVNCGGDAAQFRDILTARRFPGLRGVELPGTRFNKSLALNVGASEARAERLFFLDTDVVLKTDFLGEAVGMLGARHFVTVDRVFESHPPPAARTSQILELGYSVRLVDERGRSAEVQTNLVHLRDGSRSGPGMVLMRRKHFFAVNGMNSDLSGWGWEDLDLLVRLQLGLGLKQRRHGNVEHLTHGDERRDLDGQSRAASEHLNMARCLENYRQGHYWGTREDDARTWAERRVELAPVRRSAGRRTAAP